MKEAVCLDDVGFAEIFVGCDGKVTGLDGFIEIFGGKLAFGQAYPISRVIGILVDQLVEDNDGLLYVFCSGRTVAIGGGCQEVFVIFVHLRTPFEPLYAFLRIT